MVEANLCLLSSETLILYDFGLHSDYIHRHHHHRFVSYTFPLNLVLILL